MFESPLAGAILWGVIFGALAAILSRMRGLDARHAAVAGIGFGLVFGVLRLAISSADATSPIELPGLILIAALGGSLTQWAFDHRRTLPG
jgi:hypothetical protein